jgi:galactokinase
MTPGERISSMENQAFRREPEEMGHKIARLKDIFSERYGMAGSGLQVFAAPGRVNLIGEHIDYCGGFVFPAAITLDTTVIARPRPDRLIRLSATDLPDRVEISLDDLESGRHLRWGNYQLGVADELQKAGFPLCGADLLYHDTVPLGSGLSSSAAIELATAVALASMGLEAAGSDKRLDLVQLAVLSQMAEHHYVGVNCGIMDQFASAMGKKGHAILLDCATLAFEYAPLDLGEYRLVLGNTMKKRGLGESKYNERVRETSIGLSILQQAMPEKKHLCDFSAAELELCQNLITDPVILRRVTHVILENERVKKACSALLEHDLLKFADLLNEAQVSIRDLYEVTGFELDVMVEEARAAEGCIAARMTGAGFGGCTVNLVRSDCVDTFIQNVGENYQKRTGRTPEFYACEIGDGARAIKNDY